MQSMTDERGRETNQAQGGMEIARTTAHMSAMGSLNAY